MRIRTATAAGLALASLSVSTAPAPAAAAEQSTAIGASDYDTGPSSNIYIEARGSLSNIMEQDVNDGVDGEASFDTGFGAGASVGYHVTDQIRVELEGVVDVNDVDDSSPVTQAGLQRAPRGADAAELGDLLTLGAFTNALYDFDIGMNLSPYVGAGLGILRLDAEYGAFAVNDADVRLAYQFRTGVAWHVTRQTGLTLGYRYRRTAGDPTFDSPSGEIETDYGSHAVELGLRFRF